MPALNLSDHTVDAFIVDVLHDRLSFILTDIGNLSRRPNLLPHEKDYLLTMQQLAEHMQAVISYYTHE